MSGTRLYTESRELIYFVFDFAEINGESPYYVLFSKKTRRSTIYSNQTLIDDVTFYPYAPQIRTITPDGKFVAPISASEIVKSLQRLKSNTSQWKPGLRENFNKWATNVQENDNPIIVFYQFK